MHWTPHAASAHCVRYARVLGQKRRHDRECLRRRVTRPLCDETHSWPHVHLRTATGQCRRKWVGHTYDECRGGSRIRARLKGKTGSICFDPRALGICAHLAAVLVLSADRLRNPAARRDKDRQCVLEPARSVGSPPAHSYTTGPAPLSHICTVSGLTPPASAIYRDSRARRGQLRDERMASRQHCNRPTQPASSAHAKNGRVQ